MIIGIYMNGAESSWYACLRRSEKNEWSEGILNRTGNQLHCLFIGVANIPVVPSRRANIGIGPESAEL